MSLWRTVFDPHSGLLARLSGPLSSFLEQAHKWSSPTQGDDQAESQFGERRGTPSKNSDSTRQGSSDIKASEVDSVAFTVAAIVLSAKLAKADGRVTVDEVAKFRQLFTVPDNERDNVGRLFNQARAQTEGYIRYAKQVAQLFGDQPKVLSDLLGCLISIAVADGRAALEEIEYLRDVARIFGIDESYFQELFGEYSAGVVLAPIEDPYILLGVLPEEPLSAVRSRYRELVRESHPDRLAALNLPAERIEAATERMTLLNAAWEDIQARHNKADDHAREPAFA